MLQYVIYLAFTNAFDISLYNNLVQELRIQGLRGNEELTNGYEMKLSCNRTLLKKGLK